MPFLLSSEGHSVEVSEDTINNIRRNGYNFGITSDLLTIMSWVTAYGSNFDIEHYRQTYEDLRLGFGGGRIALPPYNAFEVQGLIRDLETQALLEKKIVQYVIYFNKAKEADLITYAKGLLPDLSEALVRTTLAKLRNTGKLVKHTSNNNNIVSYSSRVGWGS